MISAAQVMSHDFLQLRRSLSQINPDLAVVNFRTFSTQVNTNFAQQEMVAKLTSLFGISGVDSGFYRDLWSDSVCGGAADRARLVFAWPLAPTV
jgi:hypothetical protein